MTKDRIKFKDPITDFRELGSRAILFVCVSVGA